MRFKYSINDFSLPNELTIEDGVILPKFDDSLKGKFRLANDLNNLINNGMNIVDVVNTIEFDGDSAFFDYAKARIENTAHLFNIGQPFTISFWLKCGVEYQYLITNYDNVAGTGMRISVNWDDTLNKGFPTVYFRDGSTSGYTYLKITDMNNAPLTPDTWYHITFVYNGAPIYAGGINNAITLYINGVEFDKNLLSNSYGAGNAYNFDTGFDYVLNTPTSNPATSPYGHPYLKDLRLYDRELTAEEIQLIYQSYDAVVRKQGIFEANGIRKENTFLQNWNSATGDADCRFLLLIDNVKKVLGANGSLVDYDGTNAMTITELNDRIKYYGKRYIEPILVINSDANNIDTFKDVNLDYTLEVSKVTDIAIDSEEASTITIYKGEKKFVKFKYIDNNNNPIDVSDATLYLKVVKELGGEAVCEKNTADFGLEMANEGIVFCHIDGDNFEVGTYFYQLFLSFGTDYLDKSKIFKLKMKQGV